MGGRGLRTQAPLFVLALFAAAPVAAQGVADPDDLVENARIQIGPLGLTPSIALTQLGIDGNVFNDVENPRKDFTFTLSPQLEGWFRAGRTDTAFTGRVDVNYFQKFASERSVDGQFSALLEVDGNRVSPWVSGGITVGRQRVGYEVDRRSHRMVIDAAAGLDLRVASKVTVVLSVRQNAYNFDGDEAFLGSNLEETLERTTDSAGAEYRQALTVLTTVVVSGEVVRDHFKFARERNAIGARLLAGFDLEDRALISGNVRVGYRTFAGAGGASHYSGVVASFATGITLRGRTRIQLEGNREVTFSFERVYPYYVNTGGQLTLTPRLTDQWDIQARVGGQRLAYHALPGGPGLQGRLDRQLSFGAGVGYHLGSDLRIGLNVDRSRRSSPIERRDYKGYKIGTAVTYGL